MERLTERIFREILIKGCARYFKNEEQDGAYLKNCIVRLSAYEDSGLTPEEVMELAKIVKCKDCKHSLYCAIDGMIYCQKLTKESKGKGARLLMKESGFCSYGEKEKS